MECGLLTVFVYFIDLQKGGAAFDMGPGDIATQMALKNIMGIIPTDSTGQINQLAAAALFYQTYFQYALAFGATTTGKLLVANLRSIFLLQNLKVKILIVILEYRLIYDLAYLIIEVDVFSSFFIKLSLY